MTAAQIIGYEIVTATWNDFTVRREDGTTATTTWAQLAEAMYQQDEEAGKAYREMQRRLVAFWAEHVKQVGISVDAEHAPSGTKYVLRWTNPIPGPITTGHTLHPYWPKGTKRVHLTPVTARNEAREVKSALEEAGVWTVHEIDAGIPDTMCGY